MKFSKLMAFALLAAWPVLAWSQESERETKKEIRLQKVDGKEKAEKTRAHVDD